MTPPGRIIARWLSLDSTGEARQKVEIEQQWGFIPPLVSASVIKRTADGCLLLGGENVYRRVSFRGNP